MFKHPVYALFGLLVVASVAAAEWRGWTPFGAREAKVSPRTVRENPGGYRSVYFYGRSGYLRGK